MTLSDEDKAWLIEIFKRSYLAFKLNVEGHWTEDERRRWEKLHTKFKEEYEQLVFDTTGEPYGGRKAKVRHED